MAERSHVAGNPVAQAQWDAAMEEARDRAAAIRQTLSAEWHHPDAGTDAPQPSRG